MAQNENSNFLKFSQDLKKTNLGVQFGKRLFTNPGSLDPITITQTMRTLGLDIPKEVQVTSDVAQVYASGSGVVGSIQAGESAANITAAGAGTLNGCIALAQSLGIIGEKEENFATTVQFVGNVAMIVSSCGLNWSAWVGLAMQNYTQGLKNKALSQQAAAMGVIDRISSVLSTQQIAFGNNFRSLLNGEVGPLGFMAKNALASPDFFASNVQNNPAFKKLFPYLNISGLPSFDHTFRACNKTSDTFLGAGSFQEKEGCFEYSIKTLGDFKGNEDLARDYMFRFLIEPNLFSFYYANEYFKNNHLSLQTLALAYSMGADIGFIWPNKSYGSIFTDTLLTPAEFGEETIVSNWLDTPDPISSKAFSEAGIDYVGNKLFVKKEPEKLAKQNKDLIKYADKAGYLNYMLSYPEVVSRIKQVSTYGVIPYDPKWLMWNESSGNIVGRDGKSTNDLNQFGGWRKIQNYVVALEYIDMVQKDPYYFKWESERLKKYDFMKNIDFFEAKADSIWNTMMLRKMNVLSQSNVAYFLNTTPDKLIRKNDVVENQANIYTTK